MIIEKNITASGLKWGAMVTMLIDHLGIFLYRHGMNVIGYYIMRGIGRLAFPIFCFLLVEGFCATRSYWKYFFRVFIFALISEVPYELMVHGRLYGFGSNILFSFSLALLVLWGINKLENKGVWGKILGIVITVLAAGLATHIGFEYAWRGIFLVAAMYILRRNYLFRNLAIAGILAIDVSLIGLCAILSIVLIEGYNGNKGKFPKWLGYAFYPAHLMILFLVSIFV